MPSRITTYFKREVCSRRKTNTYYYHKRKWNKKVTSNSKAGTKTNIYYFNWWARSTGLFSVFWFNCYHYDGSVFRCFANSLYFWGITGNNHLPSATKHRKFKRLMRGMEQLFCFCLHFWVISLSVNEKVLHEKRFFTKYILLQSKAPLFIAYTFAQKLFIFLPFLRQETPFYVPQSFRCIYRHYETKCFEKKSLVLQM